MLPRISPQTRPSNHTGGRLSPTWSVLTDASDYPGANNNGSNPALISQYCNGSRVPPENGGMGYQVPPGTNESNAVPAPVFSLTPTATVDEGNNWINLRWGPLALANPKTGATLGNCGASLSVQATSDIDGDLTNACVYLFKPLLDSAAAVVAGTPASCGVTVGGPPYGQATVQTGDNVF